MLTESKRHLRVCRRLLQSDPVYAAMIANLDMSVGRLLQALRGGTLLNREAIFWHDPHYGD